MTLAEQIEEMRRGLPGAQAAVLDRLQRLAGEMHQADAAVMRTIEQVLAADAARKSDLCRALVALAGRLGVAVPGAGPPLPQRDDAMAVVMAGEPMPRFLTPGADGVVRRIGEALQERDAA